MVFVDLATKPMAPAELRRFSERLRPRALLDEGSRAFADAGLAYIRVDDPELTDRLLRDQRLLRLPLVRAGRELSIGPDEEAWRRIAAPPSQ